MHTFLFDTGIAVLSLIVILFGLVLIFIRSALKSDEWNRKKAQIFSPRMTAVQVDEATRKLFANPPMSAIGNIPHGYEHIDD